MRGEDLFNALGKIDEKYIEDAAPKKISFYQRAAFKWAVAAAACVCLVAGGYSVTSALTARDGDLPKIGYSIVIEGMGYEGTDELSMKNSDDINPWNEDVVLETLPVYKNLCYNEGKLSQTYFNVLDLKKQAEDLADKLGMSYGNTQISVSQGEEVYGFSLETEKGTVRAFPKGSNITVRESDFALIEKHMQTACNKSSDNETETGVYTEYSVDGEIFMAKTRSYYKGESIVEDIINFNMQSHYLTESGNYITGSSDNYLNGSEKIGDYPVISLGEAKEKLLRGEHISSAAESYVEGGEITEDVIEKADLIYYTVGNQEYYLPYYRFYVKSYSGDNDIQQYAYFYVCAVVEEYLGEITVFDGSFQ
ncbi:MAG: hypothetical protein IJW86_03530 [Clostridia bacterium]|nr:hypothetical protein [Clostridia bacterium]